MVRTRRLWVIRDYDDNVQCVLKAPIYATQKEVEAFWLGSDTNALPCHATEANLEVMHELTGSEKDVLAMWNDIDRKIVPEEYWESDIAERYMMTIKQVKEILNNLRLMRFIK